MRKMLLFLSLLLIFGKSMGCESIELHFPHEIVTIQRSQIDNGWNNEADPYYGHLDIEYTIFPNSDKEYKVT